MSAPQHRLSGPLHTALIMSEARKWLEADLAAIDSAISAGQLEDAKRILASVFLNAQMFSAEFLGRR